MNVFSNNFMDQIDQEKKQLRIKTQLNLIITTI